MTRGVWIWILSLGLTAGQVAWAQPLSDPTKPPVGFQGASQAPGSQRMGGLVLQSVLISADSRSAIINGKHVMLGEKIGGLRLVGVTETEVLLLAGATRRTLKLLPGVDKRPAGISGETGVTGQSREASPGVRVRPAGWRPG